MPTDEPATPPRCAITTGRITMAAKGLEVEIETELGPQLLLLECDRGERNDSVALVFSEDFERLVAAAKAALEYIDEEVSELRAAELKPIRKTFTVRDHLESAIARAEQPEGK